MAQGFFGKKHSEETKAKFRERNRAFVHNDETYLCIKKEEVDRYLTLGWKRGRGKSKN